MLDQVQFKPSYHARIYPELNWSHFEELTLTFFEFSPMATLWLTRFHVPFGAQLVTGWIRSVLVSFFRKWSWANGFSSMTWVLTRLLLLGRSTGSQSRRWTTWWRRMPGKEEVHNEGFRTTPAPHQPILIIPLPFVLIRNVMRGILGYENPCVDNIPVFLKASVGCNRDAVGWQVPPQVQNVNVYEHEMSDGTVSESESVESDYGRASSPGGIYIDLLDYSASTPQTSDWPWSHR